MSRTAQVHGIFPQPGQIPPEFSLPSPVAQTEYLLNGELESWNGPREEVYSPVCISGISGPSRQLIGAFPLMTPGSRGVEKKIAGLSHCLTVETTFGKSVVGKSVFTICLAK